VVTTFAPHAAPRTLVAPPFGLPPTPVDDLDDPAFMAAAGHAARLLPPEIHDALVDFADDPHRSGALLLKGMPVGHVPATPPTPTAPSGKDRTSELTLLAVARRMGQPVGYEPEHGGDLVQNILPVASTAARQVSTSSAVTLAWHTETAFHPYKPRYLLLLCLRGDPAAATTLCSIDEVLPHLDEATVDVLFQARFRTRPDISFLEPGSEGTLGAPMAVLTGDRACPTLTFDEDLMIGTDVEAQRALDRLGAVVREIAAAVVLEAGDVLVVDNHKAVHGRTPFAARFDGTDRWLQRAFVVSDLSPSAADRRGRIITTRF
jgi:L-asparagine oxygenase